MEVRSGKISAGKAGGTAGKGSRTYKLSIPSAWVDRMGLSRSGRVLLSFDGGSITIRPEQNMEDFRVSRLSMGHELLSIKYYNGSTLCTVIYADSTAKDLKAENCIEQPVKTAFGINALPSWADLEMFLEERCIPRERAGLREYLNELGVDEYDPLDIIMKTKGRMAEDDQWMEVELLR